MKIGWFKEQVELAKTSIEEWPSWLSLWADETKTMKAMLENERALRCCVEELLRRLVFHDRAAATREGLEGCIELQYAEEYLKTVPPRKIMLNGVEV